MKFENIRFKNFKLENFKFENLKWNQKNKKAVAVVAALLSATLVIGCLSPVFFQGDGEICDTTISSMDASAGANASFSSGDGLSAGALDSVSGTLAGITGNDKPLVGDGTNGSEEGIGGSLSGENTANGGNTDGETTVYETFGYTNLGLAQVSGNLNVRKTPSSSGSIVGKLTNNNACEILGEENGWYKITSGKVEGYVSAEYILVGEEALILAQKEASLIATVTTSALRVRSMPSTDGKKLDSVAKGEELTVVEVLDGWVQVEVDGYDEAYVSSEYVTVEKKLRTGNTLDELRYGGEISQVRIDLVNYALKFVGNKYVWGGNSLTKGVDCSGFTKQIYKKFGITLPRTSYTQPSAGKKIKASEAKPGDLFFYGDSSGINHVAIYIGNGKIVHAANKRDGIKISNAFYRTPKCVVRYFND